MIDTGANAGRHAGEAAGAESQANRARHLLHNRYCDAALAIADQLDGALAALDPRQIHRLHGDLHLGNVLLREGLLHVLDFDDMMMGPAVQDLWLALPGRDSWTVGLRERFLDGYEQFRLFDRSTLRLVEPLRGLRVIHYAAWLARRWHDPAFPAAWPHFGTLDYWQRETDDLEEQLALVRGELAPEPTGGGEGDGQERPAEEVTLTNRDFFWDWEG